MENSPTKFADKYKLKSPRLSNWDYSTPGYYFITICTYNHNNFFGKIINNKMELSKMGKITSQCLIDIPKHFSNIKLDEYIVMPNHVHILIKLTKSPNNCRDVACNVSTNNNKNVSTKNKTNVYTEKDNKYFSKISPKSNSISSIIRSFKSAVTRQINPKTIFFAWQPRYHDEIVKEKIQYMKIKSYIINNPKNWQKDKYFINSPINL